MYITDKQLRGHLAMWVCRQHPYRSVKGVDEVGALIDAKAKEENWFGTDEVRMKDFSGWQEVESWLRGVIWDHPQMTVWNTPKNGRDGGSIMFVSRFNHPPPEQDFIDLHALLRNVALEAWRESERNDVVVGEVG